jgi:hypothetical protein
MYTKEYNNILKTEKELLEFGYIIENNMLKHIDMNVIGHFGNCVCLEFRCENVSPIASYNNTKNVGYLIRAFVELFDLENEDGIRVSNIKNVPIRLVFKEKYGQCIGFGCFMKDRFVLIEDFIKISEKK